jgi:hypothetical protein
MFGGLLGSFFSDQHRPYEPPRQLNATLIMPDDLPEEAKQAAIQAFHEKCRIMMMTDEQIIAEQRNK